MKRVGNLIAWDFLIFPNMKLESEIKRNKQPIITVCCLMIMFIKPAHILRSYSLIYSWLFESAQKQLFIIVNYEVPDNNTLYYKWQIMR